MELERLTVAIEGDTSGLKQAVKEVRADVRSIEGYKPKVELSVEAQEALSKLQKQVKDISAEMAEMFRTRSDAQALENLIKQRERILEQIKEINRTGVVPPQPIQMPTPQQPTNQPQSSGGGGQSQKPQGGDKGGSDFPGMGKLIGALLGVRSIFSLIRRIVSQNEALMSAVNNFFNAISSILAPVLNFLGAIINTIASWLSRIFGVNTKTRASTAATSRSLMGFDELNRLDSDGGVSGGSTVDAGKLDWLTELLDGIVDTIKGLIQTILGLIATLFMSIVVIVETVILTIATLIGGSIATIWGLWSGFFNGLFTFISGLWNTIKQLFSDIWSIITNFFKNFVNGFKQAREEGHNIFTSLLIRLWSGIKGFFSDLWNTIKTLFSNLGTTIANSFAAFIDGFKNAFKTVFDWFSEKILQPIRQTIKETYEKVLKPVFEWTANGIQTLWSGLKKIVNGFAGLINSVLSVINKIPGVSIPYLPTYAKGGFPDYGEIFIANERGPEMIGKIGQNNAVVNNQQIIDGIRQGVLDAMRQANGETNIYVDGEKLFTIVTNRNNSAVMRTGRSPLLV